MEYRKKKVFKGRNRVLLVEIQMPITGLRSRARFPRITILFFYNINIINLEQYLRYGWSTNFEIIQKKKP